jgi:YbbR domain-containing protein
MKDNDRIQETEQQEAGKKRKINIRNIFYHNTFVLLFSFVSAVVIWFFMAAANEETPYVVYDVPIDVKLSQAAQEAGLQVFSRSTDTADLSISGNNMITSKLTADDFSVSVTLNPTSTQLTTGNTMQKMEVSVKAEKVNAVADYTIVEVNPSEITVEYDRSVERVFPIEDNVKFSADPDYYAGAATFSEESVSISGPESSVNRISRVAVDYTVSELLKADKVISSCALSLYDQNNQKITDFSGMYLTMSVENVEVTIPVAPKKTVPLTVNTINGPKNFAESRITIEPAEISIAGTQDVLDKVEEITLADAVDFSTLTPGQVNEIEMEIPLPSGARDITNLGSSNAGTATVSVNLNGYEAVTLTTSNISISKLPSDSKTAELTSKTVEVTIIGSEAQVAKLTGESITVTADLTNFAEQEGVVEVPATVSVSGNDTCWASGKCTVFVRISEGAASSTSVTKMMTFR